MSHFIILWERMIEARLREIVNIRDKQFGFRSEMSTIESQSLHWGNYNKSVEKRTKMYTCYLCT